MTTAVGAPTSFWDSLRPLTKRAVVALVALAVLGIVALLVVGPIQTYRDQQAATAEAEAELEALEGQVSDLQQRATDLDEDATIEEIAREEYTLVRPGEEAFALLPAGPPEIPVPQAWPFASLRGR